jgi:hypothetical protein
MFRLIMLAQQRGSAVNAKHHFEVLEPQWFVRVRKNQRCLDGFIDISAIEWHLSKLIKVTIADRRSPWFEFLDGIHPDLTAARLV